MTLDLSQLSDDTRCALIIGSGDLTVGELRASLAGSPHTRTPEWLQEKIDRFDIARERVPWDLVGRLQRDPGLTDADRWNKLERQMTIQMWVDISAGRSSGPDEWRKGG